MQRGGKAFDQPLARGIRSKAVTAGLLPEDSFVGSSSGELGCKGKSRENICV